MLKREQWLTWIQSTGSGRKLWPCGPRWLDCIKNAHLSSASTFLTPPECKKKHNNFKVIPGETQKDIFSSKCCQFTLCLVLPRRWKPLARTIGDYLVASALLTPNDHLLCVDAKHRNQSKHHLNLDWARCFLQSHLCRREQCPRRSFGPSVSTSFKEMVFTPPLFCVKVTKGSVVLQIHMPVSWPQGWYQTWVDWMQQKSDNQNSRNGCKND